jgi:membrane-associated phospholipid phosphatase
VLLRLDERLLRLLRTRWHAGALERAVRAYALLGEHGALWYLLAGLGFGLDPERRPLYARAARTVAAGYLLNQAIKLAVRRPRPKLEGLPPLSSTRSSLSYPSAHAASSWAGARALGRAWPRVPLFAAALAMSASRPYLGVHYPSDAVAGAALGAAMAELVP